MQTYFISIGSDYNNCVCLAVDQGFECLYAGGSNPKQ